MRENQSKRLAQRDSRIGRRLFKKNKTMSDKRFKWLLACGCLTCIIVSFIWKFPEAVKANTTKDVKLGEYVYVDPRSTIHVNRKCTKLNYKGWKSIRIKVDDLYYYFQDTSIGDISFCPHCVNDQNYELLSNSFASQLDNRVNEIIERRSSQNRRRHRPRRPTN